MDTHYLEYVHGQSNGAQRAVNLHALYEHAHQYESSSFKGVRNFIRFIEALQKKEKDLDEAWWEYCENNAIISNEDFACLRF